MSKQFWMVWREGGRTPVCRHSSRTAAEMEACRLFEQNPRDKFYILEAVAEFASALPPLRVTNLADGSELQPPREIKVLDEPVF